MTPDTIKTQVRDRLARSLDALEARLIAGQRKVARQDGDVQVVRTATRASSLARTAVALAMSLFLIGLFIYGVRFYSTTIRQIEGAPLVVNLNNLGLLTKVHFGEAPCEMDEPQCFTSPSFDDSAWDSVKVPTVPLQKFPGYGDGKSQSWVWYRFHVPVSAAQLASGEELAFTPLYITHQRYRAWVDGRLVDVGNTGEQAYSILKMSLPREDLADGVAVVVVKASVSPNEKGISHLRSLYVGPRAAIEQVHVLGERSVLTYFLLFLATKGSIFVVFTLFFLFSKERRALFAFLLYGFFVTIENLLVGDFLVQYLDLRYRSALYFGGKTLAIVALGTFAAEYVQAFRARSLLAMWHRALILLMAAACAELMVTNITGFVTIKLLLNVTNVILVVNLLVSLGLALLSLRQWTRAGADPRRASTLRWFIGIVAVYLGLLMWEFLGNQYFGFDKRAVFDLLFFLYMAFVTAKEFGFNQGQLITLEGHMAEKRRMEAELQEAALIAKAFVPGAAPDWEFADMAIFHRPLTETSGDWYTFERGPSGRFAHVILCDITGHGVQAALVVSTCRAVLSALVAEHPEAADDPGFLAHYAAALNNILHRQGNGFHITTMLGLTLDRDTGTLHFLAAGHPLPLLIGAAPAGGGPRPIKPLVSRSEPLGFAPTGSWSASSVQLEAGDEIIAYTDGVPLHSGLKDLRRFLASRGPLDLLAPDVLFEVMTEARRQKGQLDADDDVSCIWLRWNPHKAGRTPAGAGVA